jgi:hypothetical protein
MMACVYRPRPLIALVAAVIALSGAAGCAVPIRLTGVDSEVPRRAVPDSVDAGLDKLADAETKRRIEGIMKSPEMRNIERELINGLLDGTLGSLSDEERSKRIGELMSKALVNMMEGASAKMGPMASKMTSGAVGGALDAALSPERREALAESVGAVVSKSVKSAVEGLRDAELGASVSTAMTEQVGPAMQKALRENITRGLAEVLKDEELRRELGETARVLGREMVIGATEALAQAQPPQESGSSLARISQLAGRGARLFESATWMLGLVILALLVWIVKLMAQGRRYREEAHRREAEARLLEEVAKASEGKPWSKELLGALQERLKSEEEARALLTQRRKDHPRKDRNKKTKSPPEAGSAPPRHSFA